MSGRAGMIVVEGCLAARVFPDSCWFCSRADIECFDDLREKTPELLLLLVQRRRRLCMVEERLRNSSLDS